MKWFKNIRFLKNYIKILISLSLVFTSIVHSDEDSDSASESNNNPPKGRVAEHPDGYGRIEHKGKDEKGNDVWSVDFSEPANPGRGRGGPSGNDTTRGREGDVAGGSGDPSGNGTAGGEGDIGSGVGESSSKDADSKSQDQGNWTKRNNTEVYDPRNPNTARQEINKKLEEYMDIAEKIKNEAYTQLEQILSQDITDRTANSVWKDGVKAIIDQTKQYVKNLNTEAPVTKTTSFGPNKIPVQIRVVYPETIIHPIMDRTVNAINDQLEQSKSVTQESTSKLKATVLDSVVFSEENITNIVDPISTSESVVELYKQSITDIANDYLKIKYDRSQLGLLQDEELTPPEEELYEFLSPEGEFLDKNKAVYEKLRNANPYHEQGILAREVGLSAVEVADEEFAEGNEPEAETAFQVAEAMSDIAIGLTPYIGAGKDAYELVTGKHLLTGRTLSIFERSMSGVGLILASISGGTFSSGVVKLSLQQTGKVLSKINTKLLEKTLRGLRGSQLESLKKYQEAFFHSVENIGFVTKKGAESTLQFIKRAFTKKNPSVDEMVRVIQSTGKEGIETYTRALSEAGHQLKAENLKLPESGKEFLARQLASGYKLNSDELVEIGKISAYAEAKFGTTIQAISFPKSGQIWRAVRTSGVSRTTGRSFKNTPETVFDIHPSMILENHRYSPPGKIALFTSLDREIAVKEFVKRRGSDVLNQPYIVGSKTLDNFDGVLDLTDTKIHRQLGISSEGTGINNITRNFKENPNAYIVPNLLRETAERKGIKAILAPVSEVISEGGENFIILQDGLL